MQAHHAQHLLSSLVDGNEGRGTGRIIVDELGEELMAHLAHWSDEAQPTILRCHVAQEIGIEGGIPCDKPADQNRRSIAQGQVRLIQCDMASEPSSRQGFVSNASILRNNDLRN